MLSERLSNPGRNLEAAGSLKTTISDPDNERPISDKHRNPKLLSELSNQQGVYFDAKKRQWTASLRYPDRKQTSRAFTVDKYTFEGAKMKAEEVSQQFYGVTAGKEQIHKSLSETSNQRGVFFNVKK